ALYVAEEMPDEGLAAFVRIDPPEIEDERTGEAQAVEARRGTGGGRVEARTDDGERFSLRRAIADESPLLGSQEEKRLRPREKWSERVGVNQGILFGRRHEDRPISDQREAEPGVEIAIRPEQHPVVVRAVRPQMLEQFRRVGSVLAEPLLLILA